MSGSPKNTFLVQILNHFYSQLKKYDTCTIDKEIFQNNPIFFAVYKPNSKIKKYERKTLLPLASMTAINKVIANKEFSLISKINIKNILLGLQRRAQSSFNSRLFFVARFVGKSDSQIFSIKLMSVSNLGANVIKLFTVVSYDFL